eukprot:616576-Alexandrium_andersonii.AAC.1
MTGLSVRSLESVLDCARHLPAALRRPRRAGHERRRAARQGHQGRVPHLYSPSPSDGPPSCCDPVRMLRCRAYRADALQG